MKTEYTCSIATQADMERLWRYNVESHPTDPRWAVWAQEYMAYHQSGRACTFALKYGIEPVGEVTLLFDPSCSTIGGNTLLADGKDVASVNALRIRPAHRGKGLATALVRCAEQYAKEAGYHRLSIGVEAKETRNRAIYTHWGYTELIQQTVEDGEEVLYYAKRL